MTETPSYNQQPSYNSSGEQVWNPSVGRYFEPAKNQREGFGGIVGALKDQLIDQGSEVKAYPHSFAGIIAALEDLTFTQKEAPVVPDVRPPNGDAVPDGEGGWDWVWVDPPANGSLWFDERQGRLFIAIGGQYFQTNGADGLAQVTTDGDVPQEPVVGQFWWDVDNEDLYIFDGFWRAPDGSIKDNWQEGYTPVWRLIVDGGGSTAFTTATLPLSPTSNIQTASVGTILPDLSSETLLVQKDYNEWLYDALEAVETTIESQDYAAPIAVGSSAPGSPAEGDLWYNSATSELNIRYSGAWLPTIVINNYDTEVADLTAQISTEESARIAADSALDAKIDGLIPASATIQTIQQTLSSIGTDLANIPDIDPAQFATTSAATALTTRVTALETSAPDYALLMSRAEIEADVEALEAGIAALPTQAQLNAVAATVPDVSSFVTQQDIDSSISNITTEYLPRTGGTLSGSFVVEKVDMANPAFDFTGQKSYSRNTHKYVSNAPTTAYATFGTNDKAWEYAWDFSANEDFCWKHSANGKVFSVNKDGATAKDVVLADFSENDLSGLVVHNPISLRSKIAQYDSDVSSFRTDINALKALPSFTSKSVFYGDSAPTGNLSNGDLWFDSHNLRMNVRHDDYWIFPDRVEDIALKSSLFTAIQTSTDFESLKIKLLAVLV